MEKDDVCILIPTLNEESTIGRVVKEFKELGFDRVLVIDGRSEDRTREVAREAGAEVRIQSGRGKGQAIKEALSLLNSEVVVLINGDGTYCASEVDRLLKPIEKGEAQHVIGNRFAACEKGAFRLVNFIGNKLLLLLFRLLYRAKLRDILSGYRALSREVYKKIELKRKGFEVETELTIRSLKEGFKVVDVPIAYKRRRGKSKLSPLKDGIKIALIMLKELF